MKIDEISLEKLEYILKVAIGLKVFYLILLNLSEASLLRIRN